MTPDELRISMLKAFPQLRADVKAKGFRRPLEKKNMVVRLHPENFAEVRQQLDPERMHWWVKKGLFHGSVVVSDESVARHYAKFDYTLEV